jgi:uncharacterized protein
MNTIDYFKKDILKIIVRAGASKNEIIGYDEARQALKVNIKAPAENNRANVEIIKFFSKETRRGIKIISGLTSKKKILKLN